MKSVLCRSLLMCLTLIWPCLSFARSSLKFGSVETASLDAGYWQAPATNINSALETAETSPQYEATGYVAASSIPATYSPRSASLIQLALYNGDDIRESGPKDYAKMMTSKLNRDSDRMQFFSSRFQDARSEWKSDLYSDVSLMQSDGVAATVLQAGGDFFVKVMVGTPSVELSLSLDSGTDLSWVSSTNGLSFSNVACSSTSCKLLGTPKCSKDSDPCSYRVQYGDGSYTTGSMVTGTMNFGGSASYSLLLGNAAESINLISGASGILAIGGGSLSLPSQLRANSFSFCLGNGQSSTLDVDSGLPDPAVVVPYSNVQGNSLYSVNILGFIVGKEKVAMNMVGSAVVDTGTTISRLPFDAYQSLRDSFVSQTPQLKKSDGFNVLDTCYDLSDNKTPQIPTLSLFFSDDQILTLPALNYLTPVSDNKYCLAFAGSSLDMAIIGNVQMRSIRVGFDLVSSKIGFSKNSQC